ncbi:unnamed protein product [Acanthoscelides obtectus]|uniref:Uncharacterized protein n=1 Tax=Acanthoscelides obtectus TaxID=200917 RepID=A0A9P0K3X7_ACAOB|nr:unnamed protein product [Acanthoscelides obtectus]CAK1648021.1 hypothetical protein AOBTE_LOCUS15505 [Acanthoscelides obtectus]
MSGKIYIRLKENLSAPLPSPCQLQDTSGIGRTGNDSVDVCLPDRLYRQGRRTWNLERSNYIPEDPAVSWHCRRWMCHPHN